MCEILKDSSYDFKVDIWFLGKFVIFCFQRLVKWSYRKEVYIKEFRFKILK